MGKETKIKVALISHQGSGTNLLRAFLNYHPDIEFFGELFAENREFGKFFQEKKTVDKFLNDFFDSCDKRVVGFDVKYNQLNSDIIDYIKNNKVKVVHLHRDPARTFLRNVNKENNKSFNYWDIKRHCDWVRMKRKEVNEIFVGCDVKDITYEDMTRGEEIKELPSEFEMSILEWIGVTEFISLKMDDKHCYKKQGLIVRL